MAVNTPVVKQLFMEKCSVLKISSEYFWILSENLPLSEILLEKMVAASVFLFTCLLISYWLICQIGLWSVYSYKHWKLSPHIYYTAQNTSKNLNISANQNLLMDHWTVRNKQIDRL